MNEVLNILIVEDNPGDRRLVMEELRETAYAEANLIEASNLAEALDVCNTGLDIVLVVLDLNLPESVGLESVEIIQKAAPDAALVVLTGMSDKSLALQVLRKGVQSFIHKSDLSSAVLERTIRFSIERNRILMDLRRTNEELRSSQELLEIAQQAAKVGNWVVELFGEAKMFGSRQAREILGISDLQRPLCDKDFFGVCHPADANLVRSTVERAAETLGSFELTHRILRADGSTRWVHSRAQAVQGDEPQQVRLVGFTQDISEQKETSDRLHEHENILQLVSEFASDVIGLHDIEGRFTYVNEAVTRFLGFEVSELIGVKWMEIVHPSEVKEIEYQLDSMIRKQSFDKTITYRVRQKNGEYIWCETKFRPVSGLDRGDSKFVTVTRDVTARLASEEQIRLFSRAVEQSGDMIFLCSINRTIVYANDAACRTLKHDRSTFLGETLHIMVDMEHQSLLEQAYMFAFANGACQTELNFCRADDTVFPSEVSMSAIMNDMNEISGLMCTVRDVSERKLTEKRLREFTRELELKVDERTKELHDALAKEKDLSELKTRFMSMVSHEFRTPLTVILSSTQLLQRYATRMTDAQKNDHFVTVQREVSHLVNMLNDVMTLGRSGSIRLHTKVEPVSLNHLVEDTLLKVKAVDQGSHEIQVHNEWHKNNVKLDENLISQVLMNVLGNSLKYSAPESRIDLTFRDHDGEFEVVVADRGIGIPKNDLSRLFEPFHRADNVGTVQGTGLGMAIVHEYVSLHQGRIAVDSVEGEGTTVTITLPQ